MDLILFSWVVLAAGSLALGVKMQSFVLGGIGLGGLILAGMAGVYLRLYTKTSANEAFFRTGMGKPVVIIDGGGLVVPLIHDLTRVTLETLKMEVSRQGPDALICKDCLRVDVAAEFYIRVEKSEQGVRAAATTLGRDCTNPEKIRERLFEKLVSALRTVAATMDLYELHQNRDEFASRVIAAVKADIAPNGFILETVTISQLDQTDVSNLKSDNVFDAQGLRKATEITQAQMVIKNQIEKQAALAMTKENVATEKQILAEEQQRRFAEADQRAEVSNRDAERRRQVAEFELAQQELVERRNVEKAQAVMAAEVAKQQALEVAERERRIAVALAEAKRADAEAAQRDAEAKEREAAERVTTAGELETARREKAKAVLKAEQDGERQLIELQKAADAEAYGKTREAQAEREAAENAATAQIRLAEAALESKRLEAQGLQAVQMVPVDVGRERLEVSKREAYIPVEVDAKRVEVERERVAVLRQELEAKDEHQQAAIHLELAKAQIEAGKEVGVEMARSVGRFMEQGNFQIFGDPGTLADMTERFTNGLGITQMIGGLQEGNPLLGGLVSSGLEAAATGLDAAKAKADEFLSKAKATVDVPVVEKKRTRREVGPREPSPPKAA